MRFIAKLSFITVVALAAANAEEAGRGHVSMAGEQVNVVYDEFSRGHGEISWDWDHSEDIEEYNDRDPFEPELFSEEFSRSRCQRCGSNPCRCHSHRRHHQYYDSRFEERESNEVVEERNEGRLKITAPQCGQNFSVCSWQSICWSGPQLKEAGYDSILGFYVGGHSCRARKESAQLAVEARDICNGRISGKNIIFLGSSNIMDGGYLPFNIPYCLSNGHYQPILIAFKNEKVYKNGRECNRIKYITSAGPWIEFIRNLGGKIESPLKRIN